MKVEAQQPARCEHELEGDRAAVMKRLLEVDSAGRLAYAPVPHSEIEESWVAFDGALIGTIENRLPEAAFSKQWFAKPEAGGDELGPYHHARAAAAALLPPEQRAGREVPIAR